MGAAIGDILGFAVGVAISPIPVIAVILMLFTNKATANSWSFLIGWILGLAIAGGIVLALGIEASDGEESTTSGWIKIAIGVLFFALAWKQWSSRPRDGEEPTMPGWMSAIDSFTAVKAGGLGFVLSAVNPKNLGLTIAAMATVASAGLSTGEEIGTLVVFVLIASITVALPVVAYLIRGQKAAGTLNSMKDWLTANNNVVMMVLFIVLGAKLFGGGISVILG
jgi:threonine/homoserine/homoserine lactone efflux protein